MYFIDKKTFDFFLFFSIFRFFLNFLNFLNRENAIINMIEFINVIIFFDNEINNRARISVDEKNDKLNNELFSQNDRMNFMIFFI